MVGEELEIVGCSSPMSWVLLAKERKREEKKRRKKKEEKERREEEKVSRKLRLGNYHNFYLFFCCFCWFELGLKLVLIDWLWS